MRNTFPPRALAGLVTVFLSAALIAAPAAYAANQDRISGNITNAARAEIADSVHPRARTATDMGPTAADTKLDMSLRFSMTAAQSAALDQLLADQQNPASPQYHQWLTPAEFAAEFGLSQGDIAKVTAWLTGQGFNVTSVANGGTFVMFEGTVAQAETAFGTSIHNLSSNGETHFANITNATVPSGLADVVGSITGLHDFRARAHMHAVAHPEFTSSQSGNHYLTPGDINTIYDIKPLLTSFTGAGIGTGANCKSTGTPSTCGDIAVVGEVELAGVTNASGTPTDVLAFRTAAGLSTANLPTTVLAVPGFDPGPAQACNTCVPNSGDLQESSLDVEWAGAMAPGANLIFVIGHDVLLNSLTVAIDNNLAPIISDSYGLCEAGWGSTELNSLNQLFKQAATQGQTVIAAAGDAGAADCDVGIPTVEGLTVDFPASSPYVLAMGGTMFNGDAAATGSGTTWSATQYWAGTSGSDVVASALSYIPEVVWNEDTASNSLSAGGGGVSAFFSKPLWQTSGTPADAARDVPDLALAAASIHDPLLFCYSASCASGFRTSAGNLTVAGGTSFDSQMFGGMLALIEQKVGPTVLNGPRLGIVAPTLYALGNSATYSSSVFHDITTGNNNDPCTSGTPNCPGATEGYSAATGYDLATGWGSVDLSNLATNWTSVTPLGVGSAFTAIPSSTSLVASTTSVATGGSVTLTATITGASGTPTGTVQFQVNNAAAPGTSNVALVNGTATYTYNATCTGLGQQMMSGVYSGDATYAGSKGPALTAGGAGVTSNGSVITNPLIVTVTSSSCPDFSVAPSGSAFTVSGTTATTTVAAGGTIPSATITVAPINGFTGTVTFSASAVSTSGFTPSITFNPASLTFTSNSSASQITTVSLSGITADLHLPAMPGKTQPAGHPWYAAGSGVTVASLLILVFPRRRRLGGLLAIVLAVSLTMAATGCSSGSSSTSGGGTTTNPYIGTYQVTVQATYSSSGQTITHSSTVTYNIN